jgi:hypothetical protein
MVHHLSTNGIIDLVYIKFFFATTNMLVCHISVNFLLPYHCREFCYSCIIFFSFGDVFDEVIFCCDSICFFATMSPARSVFLFFIL